MPFLAMANPQGLGWQQPWWHSCLAQPSGDGAE